MLFLLLVNNSFLRIFARHPFPSAIIIKRNPQCDPYFTSLNNNLEKFKPGLF